VVISGCSRGIEYKMRFQPIKSGSSGNLYFLRNETTSLMIECGINYKSIMKGCDYNLSEIDACLISHYH